MIVNTKYGDIEFNSKHYVILNGEKVCFSFYIKDEKYFNSYRMDIIYPNGKTEKFATRQIESVDQFARKFYNIEKQVL